MSDANFDDLLSGQGFSGQKEKKGPKTIAEMRKEEMAKEMDPEKLKVRRTTAVRLGQLELLKQNFANCYSSPATAGTPGSFINTVKKDSLSREGKSAARGTNIC